MPENKSTPVEARVATEEVQVVIERIAQEGAQKVLQAALEAEVEEHLKKYSYLRDEEGQRVVVGNGYAPERIILTGVGPVSVRRPRVDERKPKGLQEHKPFSSVILPRLY
jgi:putative transposase